MRFSPLCRAFIVALAVASAPAYIAPGAAAAEESIEADDVGGDFVEDLTGVDDPVFAESTPDVTTADVPEPPRDTSSSTVLDSQLNANDKQVVLKFTVRFVRGQTRVLHGSYEATSRSARPVLQGSRIVCDGPGSALLTSPNSTVNHVGWGEDRKARSTITVRALFSVATTGEYVCSLRGWAAQTINGVGDPDKVLLNVVTGKNTKLTLSGTDHTGGLTWGDAGKNTVAAGTSELILRKNWTAAAAASHVSFYADVEVTNLNRRRNGKVTIDLIAVQLKGRTACATAKTKTVTVTTAVSYAMHHRKVYLHIKGMSVDTRCDDVFAVKVRVAPTSATDFQVENAGYTRAIALNYSH